MGMNNVWCPFDEMAGDEELKTTQQLRDIGRIAAVVNAAALVLAAEQPA